MVAIPTWGIVLGDECCHVYSDLSLEELLDWMKSHRLPNRIHAARSIPHFDAFGKYLEFCKKPGISLEELVTDMRLWRGWIVESRTRVRNHSLEIQKHCPSQTNPNNDRD